MCDENLFDRYDEFPFLNILCSDNYYGIGIYSIPDMVLLKANKKYLSFMDESYNKKENCIGKYMEEFGIGFKGSTYEDILNTVFKTGNMYNVDEHMHRGIDGGITYWRLSITPIHEDNKLKYCVIMTTEVTQQVLHRKKIEETIKIVDLQNENLKWQTDLLNLSFEAIFAWELNGGIVYWNKGAERIYGYSNEEVIGRVSYDLLKTKFPNKLDEIKTILLRDGIWNAEIVHSKKNGEKIIIETSMKLIIDDFNRHIVLETNRDITERKKMESELRNQKNELEEIIQSIDDAIFIYDKDKNYYLTNKEAKEYYSKTELNKFGDAYDNYKYYDFNGNQIPLENMTISKVFKGEVVINDRITLRDSKVIKHISVNGRPIYDDNGRIKFAVICSRDITQDVEAQMTIEQQKSQLQAIIDNMCDSLMVFDRDGSYTLKNKVAIDKMYAGTYNNVGESYKPGIYFDLEGNELPSRSIPSMRILNGETITEQILCVRMPEGEKYLGVSGLPLYDDNGDFLMGIVCTRDITESQTQNKIINRQKAQLETIMNNMGDLLFVLDSKGKYTYTNKLAKSYFTHGSPKKFGDDRIPSKCLDLNKNIISEDKWPYKTVLRTKEADKKVLIMKKEEQEKYFQVTAVPLLDDKGNIDMVISIATDITEHINHSKIIQQQKEELEAIIENMYDALFIINPDGSYKYHNQRALEMTYQAEKIKVHGGSTEHTEYYDMSGRKLQKEELPGSIVLKGRKVDNLMLKSVGPDKTRYLSINGSPVFDENGNMISAVVCIRDMTKYVEKEQALEENRLQLLQAEIEKNRALEKAMEMKDEFLSIISHEFKTPLNVINTAIQAMNYICGNELSDKSKKYLGMIKQNTFRQLRLVNNLLDITRANAGRIKINKKNIDIVFLTKAITESVYSYASNKGVKLTFSSSFKKKIIGIDDEKYERILLNLLSNAIKFTPEGKFIVASLSSVKGSICIKVKDNGIGIPADKIDLIFERFGQVDSSLSRQAEGTGIGLSLVKKFVEALGGIMSVKSKVGRGSTFSILLPNEKTVEEQNEKEMINLLDNRLVENTNVEFSDIYL